MLLCFQILATREVIEFTKLYVRVIVDINKTKLIEEATVKLIEDCLRIGFIKIFDDVMS